MIGPQDEQPHEVGADPAWSESYYFAWFGEEGSGITRVGIRPNEGTKDVLVVAFPPGGGIAIGRHKEPQAQNTDDIRVAGASYECMEPLTRWRVRYDGPLTRLPEPRVLLGEPGPHETIDFSLDLEMRTSTPPAEAVLSGDHSAFERVATGHFEQSGSFVGTIDGRPFAGRGHRDKSWGVRDWSAPDMWRWFAMPFGDDLVVNVVIVSMGGREVRGGWALREGAVRAVSDIELTTQTGPDGRAHTALDLSFDVEGTGRMEVHADVLEIAPLPLSSGERATLVNEGLARFTTSDGRECLGIAEYLHQLQDPPAGLAAAAALIA